jgi:hypothetical protein
MAKLLYSAVAADGTRIEGVVNAPSAVAAREQLERQGLQQVELRLEAAPAPGPKEPNGVDPAQRGQLARWRQQLQLAPTLKAQLVDQARHARWWLVADTGLVLYGLFSGKLVWVGAGLLAAAAPLALSTWRFLHVDRYQRLQRQYAMGQWDAVRALAKDLRGASAARPELDLDLDLRLACIYARDHALPDALQRFEPWRKRLATQPGLFETRVAQAHLMAGDTAGYVAQLAKAHELAPQQALRAIDHAQAQARFGNIALAETLLAQVDTAALSADERALVLWARGLVQLRRREPDAVATLAQAVGTWLQRSGNPATWTSLALCACDHAVALHEAGHHEAARERVAQVWPVLEVHATVPLLRMLEADDLLPVRSTPNT